MTNVTLALGAMFVALLVAFGGFGTSSAECVPGNDAQGRPICYNHDPPPHAPDPIKKHQPETPSEPTEPTREPSQKAKAAGRMLNTVIMSPLSGLPGASLGIAIQQDYKEKKGRSPDTAGDTAEKEVTKNFDKLLD